MGWKRKAVALSNTRPLEWARGFDWPKTSAHLSNLSRTVDDNRNQLERAASFGPLSRRRQKVEFGKQLLDASINAAGNDPREPRTRPW